MPAIKRPAPTPPKTAHEAPAGGEQRDVEATAASAAAAKKHHRKSLGPAEFRALADAPAPPSSPQLSKAERRSMRVEQQQPPPPPPSGAPPPPPPSIAAVGGIVAADVKQPPPPSRPPPPPADTSAKTARADNDMD